MTEMGLCLNFFYLIVYLNMHYVEPFVKLDCVESVIGIFNEDTNLPCSMEAAGMKTLTLTKLHESGSNDKIVYKFNSNENDTGVQGRIKLHHQDSQNVSLIIQKIQASDNGTYQFTVETDHGHASKSIDLIVRAPYTGPHISKKEENGKTFLVCTTVGYPLAQLYWKTTNETISPNSVDIARSGELYNITSCITAVDDWCSINYTCSVCIGNDCKSKELDCFKFEEISQQPLDDVRTRVGVILSFVFFILLCTAAFYCRKKFSKAHFWKQSTATLVNFVDDKEN
ncbi:butyrophilin subfamily 1 member A1-like [Hypanus sabinus]|uniref:butyrophilin subfamily 1 member A1-like n=1 Tax=Hypanus sabinus TaxID=79690 RepID=UPI0028C3E179|nr:butyrophilin subfamily 1 member A1-like [Hypanus sabinus]